MCVEPERHSIHAPSARNTYAAHIISKPRPLMSCVDWLEFVQFQILFKEKKKSFVMKNLVPFIYVQDVLFNIYILITVLKNTIML